MSKEKKRTRASTSCSVIDSSDLEQSTIPTEFTEFVRSAFEKMSVKMDNIITGQQALEIKLDLVNQQVQSNKGEIEELKKSADFVCEQLTKATCVTKENAKKTADIDKDVDFLIAINLKQYYTLTTLRWLALSVPLNKMPVLQIVNYLVIILIMN